MSYTGGKRGQSRDPTLREQIRKLADALADEQKATSGMMKALQDANALLCDLSMGYRDDSKEYKSIVDVVAQIGVLIMRKP